MGGTTSYRVPFIFSLVSYPSPSSHPMADWAHFVSGETCISRGPAEDCSETIYRGSSLIEPNYR